MERTGPASLPDGDRTRGVGLGTSLLISLLIALSIAVSVTLLWPQHGTALNWDEVDYVNAARKGVVTNLWERGSLSIPDYFRFARTKLNDTDPALPSGYDEFRDPFVRRHGHSPGVVGALSATAGSNSERSHRAVQVLGAVVLTLVLVLSYFVVSRHWTWIGLIAILVVLPWYNWHLFRSIQFHGWVTVWLCTSAVCLLQWLRNGRPKWWGLGLCASVALSVITQESGAIVAFGAVVCLAIWVRGLGRRANTPWIRRHLAPGLALVALMIVVVWPGSVLKGSLLKIPLERVYQVFFTEGEIYYVKASPDRLSYLVIFLVVVPTVTYLLVKRRHDPLSWAPLVVMALVYGAMLLRFAVSDAYYMPALAPILVLMGMVAGWLSRRAKAVAAVVGVVVMAVTVGLLGEVNADDVKADRVRRADFAYLKAVLGSSEAMMDGGHVFRHYVSATQVADLSFNERSLLIRRRGEYVPLSFEDYKGKVLGLLADRTEFLRSDAARDLSAKCPRTLRPTIVLWDCRAA